MTIFINGKQKQVKRSAIIDGMDVDAFMGLNADPIWLHQNEMWEYIYECGSAKEDQLGVQAGQNDGDQRCSPTKNLKPEPLNDRM